MLKSKSFKTNILFLCVLASEILLPLAIKPLLSGMNYYTLLVISQLIIQAPILIYLAVTRTNPFRLISFRLFNPVAIISIAAMTICVLPLAVLANLVSMLFVKTSVTAELLSGLDGPLWMNLLFVALMPAVSEELAFRGVFFHSMKERGIFLAAIISALFFGMCHLNINQFSYTIIIGFVMALTVHVTGSIYGSMIVHFILNGNSVVLTAIASASGLYSTESLSGTASSLSSIPAEELLIAVIVIAVFAVIMLIPAFGLLWSTAVICHREDEFLKLRSDWKNLFKKREPGEKRRVLDVVLLLCIVVAFVDMIFF